MVSHDMSLIGHTLNQIRIGGNKIPYYKKGGRGIVLLESVQNGGCVSVFITGVEGQVDYFFVRFSGEISVILLKLFSRRIADRGFSLFRKAESPAVCRSICGRGSFAGYAAVIAGRVCACGQKAAGEKSGGEKKGYGEDSEKACCSFHIDSFLPG